MYTDNKIKSIVEVGFNTEVMTIEFESYSSNTYYLQCDTCEDGEKPDGIDFEMEDVKTPNKAVLELLLAKWVFGKITKGTCGEISKMKPQYQFNYLMNQANIVSGGVFRYGGKNSLLNLWNEVQTKPKKNNQPAKSIKGSKVVWISK